jgi:integrase
VKGTIRVRRNKDGTESYLCQVFAGRDPATGKRRFKTAVATSKREAHRLIHQLVAEVDGDAGTPAAGTAMTLAELIETWLATGGPDGEATRNVYRGYIKLHIVPHLGSVPVRRLRVEDLDRWYVTLLGKGLSPASIRKAHNIVRGALTQAVKWGWVPVNVATQSSPPTVRRPVVATPKPATVRAMMRAGAKCSDEFVVYLRVAAVTGARPGELCGLQWRDVDWADGELHIRRRVVRASPRPRIEPLTKTGDTRHVPLDSRTLEVLAEHRNRMENRASPFDVSVGDDAFVFSDEVDGSLCWRPDSTSRKFRDFRIANGLEAVPLYGLRHQAATAMIDAGVDAKTVSERLGNSVATVLSTYTRARSTADRTAADLMGQLVDGDD